jgi:hypothetical protein
MSIIGNYERFITALTIGIVRFSSHSDMVTPLDLIQAKFPRFRPRIL